MLERPQKTEYPEFYEAYLSKVSQKDIFELLGNGKEEMLNIYSGMTDDDARYSYAEGKWSLKELLGHITDAERILACRALRMARNDKTNIPQYDHNYFVAQANFNKQSVESLIKQYELVRESSLFLFQSFDNDVWNRQGISGGKKFTVRSFPFIITGHELHHLQIIKEKYLK